ncbi:hypothetical protein [Nocardioides aquiterrae]|uniref:hypothetical protein n=1 Tax=Nocardioides aquiterrae TaxID=203799 RepID=UPI0031D3137D
MEQTDGERVRVTGSQITKQSFCRGQLATSRLDLHGSQPGRPRPPVQTPRIQRPPQVDKLIHHRGAAASGLDLGGEDLGVRPIQPGLRAHRAETPPRLHRVVTRGDRIEHQLVRREGQFSFTLALPHPTLAVARGRAAEHLRAGVKQSGGEEDFGTVLLTDRSR